VSIDGRRAFTKVDLNLVELGREGCRHLELIAEKRKGAD
jgi:hypothetical protein